MPAPDAPPPHLLTQAVGGVVMTAATADLALAAGNWAPWAQLPWHSRPCPSFWAPFGEKKCWPNEGLANCPLIFGMDENSIIDH